MSLGSIQVEFGKTVTIKSELYNCVIIDFFGHLFRDYEGGGHVVSAKPCHGRYISLLLHEKLPERIISATNIL